jgi:hypothetical protein
MKVWVPKQREVKVEVVLEDNEDNNLKKGDLQVTDADGRTRLYAPAEFEERFEQVEKNSWPGYLKRKSRDVFMNGTLMVDFDGDTLAELRAKMNAWAAESTNRHLILGDEGDKVFQGTDGRFYAIYYCYAQTNPESQKHLDERAAIEEEVRAEVEKRYAERQAKLGIDERDALTKAKEARAAQDAIDRQKQRELERLAELGRKCEHNHKKGKKS